MSFLHRPTLIVLGFSILLILAFSRPTTSMGHATPPATAHGGR